MSSPSIFLCLWMRAGEWEVRVDRPHIQTGKRHVHIRRIRNRKGEYSWNENGTRHDKHRFPASEKDIKRAKEIAAEHLNVDANILRLITYEPAPCIITIFAEKKEIFAALELGVETDATILASDEWLIILQIPKENA